MIKKRSNIFLTMGIVSLITLKILRNVPEVPLALKLSLGTISVILFILSIVRRNNEK